MKSPIFTNNIVSYNHEFLVKVDDSKVLLKVYSTMIATCTGMKREGLQDLMYTAWENSVMLWLHPFYKEKSLF